MTSPVVGKRYRVHGWRKGRFVGKCLAAGGGFWEFELVSVVEGLCSGWAVGDVVAIRTTSVGLLEEVPLGAAAGGA